jgi:hypothetical protein
MGKSFLVEDHAARAEAALLAPDAGASAGLPEAERDLLAAFDETRAIPAQAEPGSLLPIHGHRQPFSRGLFNHWEDTQIPPSPVA